MEKNILRGLVINIVLLIIGIILILTENYKWALLLIMLGLFGIIWAFYMSKKKIKSLEKGWANKIMFFLIIFVIVVSIFRYFLFNQRIDLLDLIFVIPIIIIVWFYFSYCEKHREKLAQSIVVKYPLLYFTFIILKIIKIKTNI